MNISFKHAESILSILNTVGVRLLYTAQWGSSAGLETTEDVRLR